MFLVSFARRARLRVRQRGTRLLLGRGLPRRTECVNPEMDAPRGGGGAQPQKRSICGLWNVTAAGRRENDRRYSPMNKRWRTRAPRTPPTTACQRCAAERHALHRAARTAVAERRIAAPRMRAARPVWAAHSGKRDDARLPSRCRIELRLKGRGSLDRVFHLKFFICFTLCSCVEPLFAYIIRSFRVHVAQKFHTFVRLKMRAATKGRSMAE